MSVNVIQSNTSIIPNSSLHPGKELHTATNSIAGKIAKAVVHFFCTVCKTIFTASFFASVLTSVALVICFPAASLKVHIAAALEITAIGILLNK